MKVGKYNIFSVECEAFALDGGAMFGIIPKLLWQKKAFPDDNNRISLSGRAMLIQAGDRNILVDTGTGQKLNEKLKAIYKISEPRLKSNLQKLSITTDDITDVILTHFHFDHVGGATKVENNNIVPTFANAVYHVQEEHFNWAKKSNIRERGSFMVENYMPLYELGKINLLDGKTELLPGIELIPSYGHTVSMQVVKVSSNGQTVTNLVDLMPTTAHIPLHYTMGYDLYPMKTIEEKNIFIEQALDEDWVLFSAHDPEIEAFKLKKAEKGVILAEAIKCSNA